MFDLTGKKGLIVGIANEASIAYGCATVLRGLGAELAVTYLNAKAEPHVRPLAEKINSTLFLPCNVEEEGELEAVFESIKREWGQIDFVIHSIAYAPKDDLHGRVADCSREGFLRAMDVSCHSFIRMAKLAEPLMPQGGCLLTMSYYGAERVIPNYGLMGPVKAALEGVVKYLAAELGSQGIRVHALSPGPLQTRAASGIKNFNTIFDEAQRKAPLPHAITPDDIGSVAAMLISDAGRALTGNVTYIDAGYHVLS